MKNNLNILLVTGILLLILGCGSKSETKELKSGRLKFVKTLYYGMVGTHGSHGWYVGDRQFYVDDYRWKPVGIDVNEDIADCETSPNLSVEAIKCYSFADSKELAYILRMNGDKPEWIMVSDALYDRGDNLGLWVGEGHWLLFTKKLFNVETSEQKEIKGLPDDPKKYFRGISPDLETIVYQEDCFRKNYDLSDDHPFNVERDKKCKVADERYKNGIFALWVIDIKTGNIKIIEFKKDKYDWLYWNQDRFRSRDEWLMFFQKQLVWEKDKDGKYQLTAPN